jgi:hypothetical protein
VVDRSTVWLPDRQGSDRRTQIQPIAVSILGATQLSARRQTADCDDDNDDDDGDDGVNDDNDDDGDEEDDDDDNGVDGDDEDGDGDGDNSRLHADDDDEGGSGGSEEERGEGCGGGGEEVLRLQTNQVKIGRRINQRGWINQRGRVIISYVVLLFRQVALFATSSKYIFIPLLFRLSAQNRAALCFSTS